MYFWLFPQYHLKCPLVNYLFQGNCVKMEKNPMEQTKRAVFETGRKSFLHRIELFLHSPRASHIRVIHRVYVFETTILTDQISLLDIVLNKQILE